VKFRRAPRQKAPPDAWPWRFLYPAVLVVFAVIVALIAANGSRDVLNSSDGQARKPVTDPTAPGYIAQVTPTPTLLVAHVTPTNDLVGVTVFALAAFDKGGTGLLLPAELIVSPDGQPLVRLKDVYAKQGLDGLRTSTATLLGIGFDEAVSSDRNSAGAALVPAAPVTVVLADPLKVSANGKTETVLPKGTQQVRGPDQYGPILEIVNPGEQPINRVLRQRDLWQAWIKAIAAKGPDIAVPAGDAPLLRFLRGLGSGTTTFKIVPHTELVVKDFVLYRPIPDEIHTLVLAMVPFPIPSSPGARPRVAVYSGNASDLAATTDAARKAVAAGGQVVLLGNAPRLDLPTSRVVYTNGESQAGAETIAKALGISSVSLDDSRDSTIDVAVTLGADYRR